MLKRLIQKSLAFSIFIPASIALAADAYPSQPITIVVAYPPGGSTDVAARFLAQDLSKRMNQQVVVDNRSGAAGAVGTMHVSRATPDGHTLLFASSAELSVAPSIRKSTPYDPKKDLAPVAMVAHVPFILAANKELGVSSVQELVEYAKANAGKVNYSSFGNGTSNHMVGEAFKLEADIDMVHVPYRGSAPSLQDLVGGQVQLTFDTITALLPLIESGRVTPLAIATPERSSLVPDIPTVSESGFPGFVGGTWFGIMAPKDTPAAVIEKASAAIQESLSSPEMTEQFLQRGFVPAPADADALAAHIQSEGTRWKGVAEKIGLQLD